MSRSLILFATLALSLAGCDQSPPEPASAAPDAADTVSADSQPVAAAQPSPANASADALPLKKPSATDATMPGATVAPIATVGAGGFGALRFGMSRSEAEQAAGGAFAGAASTGACVLLKSPGQPGVAYLFNGDKLQRIDVQAPEMMADGGGRIGMQIDDIRTLYAGHLTEQARKSV
ncbi:MAG TPA: hypothetical protein VK660_10990, partial [Xanthomonadaceae bacterium]|nr:hypothetical protein [Xanthomonadaceae bacterium]